MAPSSLIEPGREKLSMSTTRRLDVAQAYDHHHRRPTAKDKSCRRIDPVGREFRPGG
jgi:hypothetical protein